MENEKALLVRQNIPKVGDVSRKEERGAKVEYTVVSVEEQEGHIVVRETGRVVVD